MLGKLIKHEFKATGRIMMGLLAALIGISVLYWITGNIDFDNAAVAMVNGLVSVGYVLILIASFSVTLVYMIVRFYKSMLGDEGYLSFTLPVKTGQLILAKWITAVVWIILTVLLAIASGLLNFGSSELLRDIWDGLDILFEQDGAVLTAFLMVVYMVVSVAFSVMLYYTAMAFGQTFHSHKIIWSIVGYFILDVILQIINVVVMLLSGNMAMVAELDEPEQISEISDYLYAMSGITAVQLVEYLVLIVGAFFLCRALLKNKLNLE